MPSSRRAMLRRMSAAAGWMAAGVAMPAALSTPAISTPARAAAPPPADPDRSPWFLPEDVPAISIDLPQLRYEGHWAPRPGAMRVLARELRLRTRLEPVAEPTTVEADDDALFDTPFLYIAGDEELPKLAGAGEARLRQFLDLGGLAVFDAADGGTDLAFTRAVEDLLSRISPGSDLGPVARDHVLFRSFYLVDSPVGRTSTVDHLLAIQEEGRIKALLMRNDLGGALAETADGRVAHPCVPGGAEQRQWAIRLGVNILLYATCTDYKADRAHVETLLRARRWR